MRTIAITAALAALATGAGAAEEGGAIRSGEHPGFSRLVMTIEPTTEWSLENLGGEARILFPGKSLGFDADGVFERMPRERVQAVEVRQEASGTVIGVQLGCECRVTTSFVGGRLLALDIHDRAPGEGGPAPAASAEAVPASGATGAEAGAPAPEAEPAADIGPAPEEGRHDAASITDAERILVAQIERAAQQGLIRLAEPAAPQGAAAGPAAAPAEPQAQPIASVDHAPPAPPEAMPAPEQRSEAEAAPATPRAAPRPRRVAPAASRASEPVSDPQAAAEVAPQPPAKPQAAAAQSRAEPPATADAVSALAAHEQIDAVTVYDRDNPRPRHAAPEVVPEETKAPEGCFEDAALDVAGWSSGAPLHDELPGLQRRLLGEFDRPDPAAVRDVARLYIRFGFGAEAEQVLKGFGAEFPDRRLLADLARAVEGRPLDPGGPLSLDAGCPGRHGLWQAIAGASGRVPAERFARLEEAFAELPPDLRDMVGPALIGHALDAGSREQAELLLTVASRAGVAPSAGMRLAGARLLAAQGQPGEAEMALGALVAENAPNATEALIRLVELRLEGDGAVPEEWITDLAAAALEQRGHAAELPLRRLRAESLARNGGLAEAVETLLRIRDDLAGSAGPVAASAARIFSQADPEVVGAAVYATAIIEHGDLLSGAPESDAARLLMAERLLGLGLPQVAATMLAPALVRNGEAALLLAAEARLDLGQPDAALGLLAGLEGRPAAELRARAHARRDDFASAVDELAAEADAEAIAPYAWASGSWELVGDGAGPEQAAMAAYMRGPAADGGSRSAAPSQPAELTPAAAFEQPLPVLEDPSLRSARSLVETGREVGSFVRDLLDTP